MSIGIPEQIGTGAYYFELGEELGGKVYAETKLPEPGNPNPTWSGGTLLGEATNETGIAKRIAELLTDAGQVTAVRICTKGEHIRCGGGIYLNRRYLETEKLERIIALVAERKPGLQILRLKP